MKLYSENRAAKMLGVSRGTLHKEADNGNIPYHVRNGRRRYSDKDVKEYINRQYVAGNASGAHYDSVVVDDVALNTSL